jgi:hypothetical protein
MHVSVSRGSPTSVTASAGRDLVLPAGRLRAALRIVTPSMPSAAAVPGSGDHMARSS